MVDQRETSLWIIDDLVYLASHFYSWSGRLILEDSLTAVESNYGERGQYFLNETLQQSLIHPLRAV